MSSDVDLSSGFADEPGTAAFGQRLLALFDELVEFSPEQREPRISATCAGAPALEKALRALLARDSHAGHLDTGVSERVAPLLNEALPAFGADPERIGPYRVLRRLGEGGMGRVYLAERSDSEVIQQVAVKLIRSDRVSPGLVEKFEAERRHLATLDHPGICRFIDAARLPDGNPYVVMEAVEGEPILDYCARLSLDITARLRLLRKLVAAVAHAHDRLLVHRDIKPQNVLVTADGEPKLLDFGIAKSLETNAASLTRTAERFFTPNSSAPEQLLGGSIGVGCDVYALGALAYELLSGQPPFEFEGLRAAEIERLILQVAPAPMSARAPEELKKRLRGDLDAIVSTCLRKARAERYANVGAFDADLQRFEEGRPVRARPQNWRYRTRLFVRRHRVAMSLSAALILAILGSATALGLQALELREQRNLAVVERDRALQVVEILESAFRNADPAQAAGDTVTARQILDAAVPSIDALETTQPQVFARMAATLASVELDLTQSAKAVIWVERGLRVADRETLPSEVFHSLLFSGAIGFSREGDSTKAAPLATALGESAGTSGLEYALADARVKVAQGNNVDASARIADALERFSGRSSDEFLLNELRWLHSIALENSGRRSEASAVLESMLDWQHADLPETHPWVLLTRLRLARVQAADRSDVESMIRDFESIIGDLGAAYGESSAVVSSARGNYGYALFQAGQAEASANQLDLAWRAMVSRSGFDNLLSLQTGLNYAYALREIGSKEQLLRAEQVISEVAAISIEKFGYGSSLANYANSQHVLTLLKLERFQQALKVAVTPGFEDHYLGDRAVPHTTQVRLLKASMDGSRCEMSPPDIAEYCRAALMRIANLRPQDDSD